MAGLLLAILLVMSANTVVQSTLCSDALAKLMNCLPFLLIKAPAPSFACCQAVKDINQEASTKEVRQELCKCFKGAASQFKVDPGRVGQLPQDCKVQVPVPIRPDVDCSK
ncbi:hypothetical protein Tsubulata_002874 [Turnera subulata]|uniref:Bifunctional inhibitor/plant lipid transfer protein/seed storage helical domain-containing protein n=1 Tax=Turnera subulata TaxID=218843 RepID=A0A9Q0FBN7_9ROSI|nr:hypothetical protein Tsubulata_002874 [Turnera subulata]